MTVDELPGDSEANDVVGELSNMVRGGLKSQLCDAGRPRSLSIPSVIRGRSFEIRVEPEATKEGRRFACNRELITVEVPLKFK